MTPILRQLIDKFLDEVLEDGYSVNVERLDHPDGEIEIRVTARPVTDEA